MQKRKGTVYSKILNLIGQKPQYPSEMARNLGIIRTTIQYRLNAVGNCPVILRAREALICRVRVWASVIVVMASIPWLLIIENHPKGKCYTRVKEKLET